MSRNNFLSYLIALILFLTGCTAPTPVPGKQTATPANDTVLNPKEPVQVVLWHYYVSENQQMLEDAVRQFNQSIGAEQGIIIESIAKGSIAELETAVSNSAKGVINSEPMPDIFSSYPDKAIEIDALNMLTDLNQYFTEQEKQEYIPGFLSDGVFQNNRFLILPIVKSTELLYLNASAWKQFAAATGAKPEDLATWEGLLETSRQYYMWTDAQTPDILWDGKSMAGLDSIPNFVLVGNKQLDADMVDADHKEIILNLPILRKIFDIYVGGMAMEYFNASGKFRSDNIKSGELIAYTGSSSSAAYFPIWIEQNNSRQDIDFMALPYPTFAGGASYAIQQGAGMCIAKSTPAKELGAALFLKWFTAQAQNVNFAMSSGYLPVKTAAYNDQYLQEALNKLRQGSAGQKNVAAVYNIALEQIATRHTYAAKPFAGSYKLRFILQSTLSEAAEAAKKEALSMKSKGLGEIEIVSALDMDARFQNWITTLQNKLDNEGVAHRSVPVQ